MTAAKSRQRGCVELTARGEAYCRRFLLEEAVVAAIAALDALDGDPDLEEPDEDGGACEDEGHDSDTEPDEGHFCTWRSGEVDQTKLTPHAIDYRDSGDEPWWL